MHIKIITRILTQTVHISLTLPDHFFSFFFASGSRKDGLGKKYNGFKLFLFKRFQIIFFIRFLTTIQPSLTVVANLIRSHGYNIYYSYNA